MKKKPLVSVIIGYYNRENLVDESVESILNQTYENLEIIIFDDCSTDGTYEKLSKYKDDERVTLYKHKKNIGFVSGLINAIDKSKGKYIAIHGSGDVSLINRIKWQVNFIKKNECAAVTGWVKYINNDKEDVQKYSYQKFLQPNQYTGLIAHGSILFSKKDYYEIGGYRKIFTYAQDYDLLTRMRASGKEIGICNEVIYKCDRTVLGVKGNPEKRIIQKYFVDLANQNYSLLKKKDFRLNADSIHVLFLRKNNIKLAFRFLKTGVKRFLKNEIEDSLMNLRESVNEVNFIINYIAYWILNIILKQY